MIHRLAHVLVAALAAAAVCAAQDSERPNIVLIMADDLGYECLSCHGSEMYETPNLDALAASGMRFRNAHSQPICTPARVQIMTGIYNNRNYVKFGFLDPTQLTFANILKGAGYATCIAGKWQLKGGLQGPNRSGFDKPYCLWQVNRRPSRYPNPGLEIDGEQKDFKNGEFGPDVVTDYICEFMAEQKKRDKPFFVYYPMILPHWPFVPTPGSDDWDPKMWRDAKGEPGGYKEQKYWDLMVSHTDKMVGKVVSKLDELGLRENTLVLFTGDNGTFTGVTSRFNGRMYKGGKGTTKDAGTHVPFLASWPGTIAKGQVRDELVDFTDVLPTLAEVGEARIPESPKLDGRSVAPLLRGGTCKPRDYIYCWYQRNGVRNKAAQLVRTARYKLYANGRFFDVEKDPLERSPIPADGIPDAAQETHAMLKDAIERHVRITKAADPEQRRKRQGEALPEIKDVPKDLTVPTVSDGPPAPGQRVRMTAAEYGGTEVHHLLYLPTDWEKGRTYPVIVEYAGNGPYRNEFGDTNPGTVEGSHLGYGISGGKGFLWLCLPFVDVTGTKNQKRGWGDLEKTVAYCKTVVPRICQRFGGDRRAVLLAGFSRGSVACNFVGLHDDEIAKLWCGFICYSNYDSLRHWQRGADRVAARVRLGRLGGRPQWICNERTVADVRRYLVETGIDGRFTFRDLPFRNHNDTWVLRDVPLRREVREFARATVAEALSFGR